MRQHSKQYLKKVPRSPPRSSKKGLDHLDAVRTTFQAITDRFAGFQAEWLNSHVDFPLLQRLACPITVGAVRYPGLKPIFYSADC